MVAAVVPAIAGADGEPRAALVEVGRAIFFDPALSEPRGTSCASCHDPERAFWGDNGSRRGVPRGSRPGHFARRNAPSLLYLRYVPAFQFAPADDDSPQPEPRGGLFWDGRADSIAALVRQPLLNPDEMNNRDARAIAAKVARAPYAAALARETGAALGDGEATLVAVGRALEAFLTSKEMAPFSSRFDAFVTGRGKLTPFEREGMLLFRNPGKGGCGGCHLFYDTGRDPALSMFSNYGYDAVAAPRNPKLAGQRKPDLGLCERTDRTTPSTDGRFCASFRTPSLRNVAVRGAYMHNGVFTSLRDVVAFYATRATDPMRWYKSGVKFDDVPAKFRGQVNVASIPYNRREGDAPALNDREIDAIVAFLETLTDERYRRKASGSRIAPELGPQ
ncbi:MAG TPA: cytochrome c peroxidase [Polyangia bacterium]|nr:cytochrome c peroxidase [Polyangia bacterium]